jgi:hypothetical protein
MVGGRLGFVRYLCPATRLIAVVLGPGVAVYALRK